MDNCGVCYLSDWPPQSPDLNIIEALWSGLKGSVAKCRRTLEDLWGQMVTYSYRKNEETVWKIEEIAKMKGRNTYYWIGEFQMVFEHCSWKHML